MKKIISKKSQIVKERIEAIQVDIKSYKESVTLLDGYANGRLKLKGKDYTTYAADYKRTIDDDKRYRWSRNHIKFQIALLERELEVLIKYGA